VVTYRCVFGEVVHELPTVGVTRLTDGCLHAHSNESMAVSTGLVVSCLLIISKASALSSSWPNHFPCFVAKMNQVPFDLRMEYGPVQYIQHHTIVV
jgi:hypothetical protein